MKKLSEYSGSLPFYFFTLGLYLIIICQDIFSNGMFMDGLIYSTVSKNMADGSGTFWNPHFTATCLSDFHEHPPLAFLIQSIFYRFLGTSRYIDKIYSQITVLITGLVILKIWKSLGYKHGWITLLLWLLIPTVFWASSNNLLENTLVIFTSLSILFYLKAVEKYKYIFIFLSGFMLAFGFLTKGFVAFFPWTFPFMMWLFLRKMSFGRMIGESAGLFISSVVPLLVLVLIFPEARISLEKYIENQVIGSLRNAATVDSRFFIVKRFLTDIAPEAVICTIFLVWSHFRKSVTLITGYQKRMAIVFFFVSLTGVLPVLISMKQSGFYILPTYPLFAIGAGILIYPSLNYYLEKINYTSSGFRVFKIFASCLFIISIMLSVFFSNGFSRDKDKIKDISAILPELPTGSIINIDPSMSEDWSMHAYFGRYKNISLDWNMDDKREYLLIRNGDFSDTLDKGYITVRLDTKDYKLLKRQIRF